MKIIMPVNDDRETVCPSFGRAPLFLVYDEDKNEKAFIENPGAEAQSGAGLKAAQAVSDSGAKALLTPRCGENSAQVLNAAEISVYKTEGINADENIEKFRNNLLQRLTHFHAGYHGIR